MTDSSPENLEIKTLGVEPPRSPVCFYISSFLQSNDCRFHSIAKNVVQFPSSNARQGEYWSSQRALLLFPLEGNGPPEDLLPPSSHTVGSLFPYCSPSRFQHRHAHHYSCQSQRGGRKKSCAQMTNSGWCQVGLAERDGAGDGGW